MYDGPRPWHVRSNTEVMTRTALLSKSVSLLLVATSAALALPACSATPEGSGVSSSTSDLSSNERRPRYERIRNAAAARGITNTSFLLAGIAMDETGLAQCWSEATWACRGPSSPDCGGGPTIAGSADGPCSAQQGGIGMFQFDAGNFNDTLRRYGNDVLTIEGQVSHAVDYVVNMVKISDYTTDAETDDKARAWINRFDVNNHALRDQWISTVVRYYNGCERGWSCWSARYGSYSDGLNQVLADTGGTAFWTSGTTCPGGSGVVGGAIDAKYRALGGCGSMLGVPRSNELATPDGIGRYTVFDHGSIYWTDATGAFEVNGVIRDQWKVMAWEAGPLGYPVSDEQQTPDLAGRYNVFQHGSIYWSEATGAHEVLGAIRDKYKSLGWEAGALGYPISGEYDVAGGRRSDFQHGSLMWASATTDVTVTMSAASTTTSTTDGGAR
jgi:hypothetical protein